MYAVTDHLWASIVYGVAAFVLAGLVGYLIGRGRERTANTLGFTYLRAVSEKRPATSMDITIAFHPTMRRQRDELFDEVTGANRHSEHDPETG